MHRAIAIEAATKPWPVNARMVVCSWSILMSKLCLHLQQSWAVTWTSSALLSAQQTEVHVVDWNHNFFPYSLHQEFYYKTLTYKTLPLSSRSFTQKVHCLCDHPKHICSLVWWIFNTCVCVLVNNKTILCEIFLLTTNSMYTVYMYNYNHTIGPLKHVKN